MKILLVVCNVVREKVKSYRSFDKTSGFVKVSDLNGDLIMNGRENSSAKFGNTDNTR